MAVHIATPEEIAGAHDNTEIKGLHLTGPYQGMVLVNKRNDDTLDDAVAYGEVLLESGADIVLPSELPLTLIGANPPLAYPADFEIAITGTLTGTGTPTSAIINVNGGLDFPVPLTIEGNVYKVPYEFEAPGAYVVRLRLNTGDWGESTLFLEPVV